MNEFLIELQAKLDEAKSKGLINADIDKIQGQLNKLKLQAEIDPNTISNLVKQLEGVINQKITISNINVDTSQAVKNGKDYVNKFNQSINQELSKSEKAINSFKSSLENAGKSSSEIDNLVEKVKALNVQIDSLRFKESTDGIMNIDVSGLDKLGNRVKITQSLIQDLQTMKWNVSNISTSVISTEEIEKINNVFSDYTARLAQFKSTNNNILSGLSEPLSDFENKLNGLKNGTSSINDVKNSFSMLKAEASKVSSNLSGELNKVDKAVRNITNGKETISGLRAEFKGLSNTPKEINSELNKLSTGLKNIKNIEAQEGRTANWSAAYKEWEKSVDSLRAKLRVLKKEQSNVASTQIFNTSDLRKADIPYMTKVSNTIEKQMAEIQKMSNAKGWKSFDVKGIEQADGLIKKLTLTVTDAEGAIKKLNFQREQLKGNGKAQPGLMQTGDVQIIKTAAQAQEELAQKTQNTNTKLDEQRTKLVNKIQLQLETGGYESKVETLISKTRQWTDETGNARISTINLSKAFDNLKAASDTLSKSNTVENQKALVAAEKELDAQVKTVTNSVKIMNASLAKDSTISSLHQRIQEFYDKNGATHRQWGVQLKQMLAETASGASLTNERVREIEASFIGVGNAARQAGKLGKSGFQKLTEGMKAFSYWGSSTFIVTKAISKFREAFTELKEINNIMTEISKVSQMTVQELSKLGDEAFKSASKYGKKASDYLTGIQDFSRAGFRGGKENDMAELSVLAQAAGDMDAELSNKYLIATDAAYKLNGEASKLNEILDGQNYIANNNATSMEHLADATRVAASQASSAGVAVEQMSAAIGTMVSVTQDSGETAGRAFKAILMNLQQVSGELEDGEVIDEESLTKYEKACNDLGVSLKTVKDGVISLRNPMEILKELADAYTSLDKMDARRAGLISAIGGRIYHVIQKCITRMNLIAGNPLELCTTI